MSIQISISKEDLLIIKQRKKTETNAKFLRRYLCLSMLSENYLKKDIASTLGVNIDTVTDWIKIYNTSGLQGLGLLHYYGRRPSCLDSIQHEIIKIIEKENVGTIKELQSILLERFSFEIEHSWLYRFCKKNSIALIKKRG
jgi:transposase